MTSQHIVVDGSNIATEGRSTPSLAQLESAVAELRRELPDTEVTVVVDATFAHRIDPSELPRFEEAALRGQYVYPPAGAIGRGDAFLLRIAERVGGTVLSNDSFQEFHGEHEWLFQPSRLLGGTPVPGIGWIFVPRNPVRGPKSRVAVRDATRAKARVEKAIKQATKEVVTPGDEKPESGTARRRSRTPASSPQAVNDPLTFISFIAEHHLGDVIDAEVEGFTSHGAVAQFGGVRCYVPLSGLGSPAPRRAREVLHRGEVTSFVITALDPHRRGVELALPDVAVVSGRPSDETVEAEVKMARREGRKVPATKQVAATGRRRVAKVESLGPAVDSSWPLVPSVAPVRARVAVAQMGGAPGVGDAARAVAGRAVTTAPRKAVATTAPKTAIATTAPATATRVATAPAKRATVATRGASKAPGGRAATTVATKRTAAKSVATPSSPPRPVRTATKKAAVAKVPARGAAASRATKTPVVTKGAAKASPAKAAGAKATPAKAASAKAAPARAKPVKGAPAKAPVTKVGPTKIKATKAAAPPRAAPKNVAGPVRTGTPRRSVVARGAPATRPDAKSASRTPRRGA